MKRSVVLSAATIVIAALLLCSGTYAYFSGGALSDANTFDAGMINLLIRDHDEAYKDGISATWSSTNMKPGDDLVFDVPFVGLKNTGTLTANTLDIAAASSVPGHAGMPADDMDKYMQITRMTYSDSIPDLDLLPYLADANGNGWKDLDDLEHTGPAGEPAITGVPAPVGVGGYGMDLRFRPEAGSTFQGMTLVTDFTFTLNQ